MFDISFGAAFLAGLLTFFAPCTLPLIPAFVAFLGGAGNTSAEGRRRIILGAFLFWLGFAAIFMLYGIAAGALGRFLIGYREEFLVASGALVLLFGLFALDIIPARFLTGPGMARVSRLSPGTLLGASLLGAIFALGWSPCIGPILGSILILAGNSGTVLSGALLLLVYAFGLGLPFILSAVFYDRALERIPKLSVIGVRVGRASGWVLVALGIIMLSGYFGYFAGFLASLGGGILPERFMDFM